MEFPRLFMRQFLSSILLWILLLTPGFGTESRIWFDARINGKPVRIIFDTGCNSPVIFTSTAARLHLKVINPPPGAKPESGGVLGGYTEPCDFTLWGATVKTSFRVIQLPEGLDFYKADGMLGWHNVRNNIFGFNGTDHRMSIGENRPPETDDWQRFPIRKESGCLILDIPKEEKSTACIMLDTGSNANVGLSPENWKKWKETHPLDPVTYISYYMPGAGLCVDEVMLAQKLNIGPFEMTRVLIRKANIAELATEGATGLEATLPFNVLDRRDLFIDGKNGYTYFSPEIRPAKKLTYNRLGAVFVPMTLDSNPLFARIAKNSPAERAGIQNNDMLLKIGSLDVTRWREKKIKFAPFFEQPEGTKITLTLKRGGQVYQVPVVLKDFLEVPKAGSSKR